MYIAGIISYMRGWQTLQADHPDALAELLQAIEMLQLQYKPGMEPPRPKRSSSAIDTVQMEKHFSGYMTDMGWTPDVFLEKSRLRRSIDLLRDKVAAELFFGKHADVESMLFLQYPLFITSGQINVGTLVLPAKKIAKQSGPGAVSFEYFRAFFSDMNPMSLRYPFVIIGISDTQQDYAIYDLTSDIDFFLMGEIGYTLEEMILSGEQTAVEFKEMIPDSKKVAQEVCGLANLPDGGLMLLGIADNGGLTGLPDAEIDDTKLTVINITRATCDPVPEIVFTRFSLPEIAGRSILAVRVHAAREKPCTVTGRVYIRVDSSVRAANAAEIRKLVLS